MKAKSFGLVFLVVVLGLALSACTCTRQIAKGEAAPPPPKEEVIAPAPAPPPPPPQPAPPPPRPAPAATLQSIYFDLNKSVIRPDAAETLRENLAWFKQNPNTVVKINGNCDPRASEKFNHKLGQKRANATKKYLVGLGVDPALLEAVSYGKDRTTCTAKKEACWARERRVDFEAMH